MHDLTPQKVVSSKVCATLLWCGALALGNESLIAPARAAILPVAQSRQVSAAASGTGSNSDSQTLSAPNFDPFDAVAKAQTTPMEFGGDGGGSGTGAQSSTIGANTITASGFASATAFANQGNQGHGDAQSDFSITFQLTAPSHVTMSGSVDIGFALGPVSDAHADLTGPNGVLAHFAAQPTKVGSGTQLIVFDSILAAGVYTLSAHASGSAFKVGQSFDSGSGSFNVTLSVPEPSTLALAGLALAGFASLAAVRRLRRDLGNS